MKLGAQLYSVRNHTQTPEDVAKTFAEMKAIGYETVQLSAICPMAAEEFKKLSETYGLGIPSTHTAADRIINDTDAVIAEHKLFGCKEVGIGSMPVEYRGSIEGVRKFIKDFTPAMEKIKAAGLHFAYHNHAFEFDDLGGTNAYEILINEMPGLFFIVDTYWLRYAGQDIEKTIERLADRIVSVHFKDMASEPQGAICPCGDGVLDFKSVLELCKRLAIPEAFVEQDNAPDTDSYACMKKSFEALRGIFGL
jgi:sugar phosphate isomerase/epimerase